MVAHPYVIMYEVELGADEQYEGLHAPPTPPPIADVNGRGAGVYPIRYRRSVLGNLPYDR